jgi:hypothetical protein
VGNLGIFLVSPAGARGSCRAGALVDFPLAHAAALSWPEPVSCGWGRVDRVGDAGAFGLVRLIRATRVGYACPSLSHQASGGYGPLSLCAQSHVCRSCFGDSRAGAAFGERPRVGLRGAGLAGVLAFCDWLRGTYVAPDFWRGVREILCKRSALDSALAAVAWRVSAAGPEILSRPQNRSNPAKLFCSRWIYCCEACPIYPWRIAMLEIERVRTECKKKKIRRAAVPPDLTARNGSTPLGGRSPCQRLA